MYSKMATRFGSSSTLLGRDGTLLYCCMWSTESSAITVMRDFITPFLFPTLSRYTEQHDVMNARCQSSRSDTFEKESPGDAIFTE